MFSQGIKNTQGQLERFSKEMKKFKRGMKFLLRTWKCKWDNCLLKLQMLQEQTGFSGTTLDNPRNETCKIMEVKKDEEKEIYLLTTESKVT